MECESLYGLSVVALVIAHRHCEQLGLIQSCVNVLTLFSTLILFLPLASSPACASAASDDRARRATSVLQFLTCPEAAPLQITLNWSTMASNHNANDAKQPHPQVAATTNQHDATGTATENHSDLKE